MPYFQVTYVVEGRNISDVLGRFAFPDGDDRTDNVVMIDVREAEVED